MNLIISRYFSLQRMDMDSFHVILHQKIQPYRQRRSLFQEDAAS